MLWHWADLSVKFSGPLNLSTCFCLPLTTGTTWRPLSSPRTQKARHLPAPHRSHLSVPVLLRWHFCYDGISRARIHHTRESLRSLMYMLCTLPVLFATRMLTRMLPPAVTRRKFVFWVQVIGLVHNSIVAGTFPMCLCAFFAGYFGAAGSTYSIDTSTQYGHDVQVWCVAAQPRGMARHFYRLYRTTFTACF
jgi:hypothetical protein